MVFHPLFIGRYSKVLGMSYGHWQFYGVSFQKLYLKISLLESIVFFLILMIYLFDFSKPQPLDLIILYFFSRLYLFSSSIHL